MPSIETVSVCGAGTMGAGIAQVAALNQFYVTLYDLQADSLDRAKATIEAALRTMEFKGRLEGRSASQILQQIQFSSDINDCVTDIVIEAVVENIAVKTALFNRLAEINHSETLFASNTSSLSISAIANNVVHPGRVVGMHFFNPAPLMKLVEIVKGEQTTEEVAAIAYQFIIDLGKTPVYCNDSPGFIVNRVARHYYLEALRLAEKGIPIETIDTVMEARGFKMGPFRLMDLIGNDINLAVTSELYEALGKPPRLEPSTLQQEKVRKGELGKKSGKGYYNHGDEAKS